MQGVRITPDFVAPRKEKAHIMYKSLFASGPLSTYLNRLGYADADRSYESASSAILDIAKKSKRDYLHILQGFDTSLDTLDSSVEMVQTVIGFLEEAGGLCVRARNYIEEPDGLTKYKDKISEAQDWYMRTLSKIDDAINTFSSGGVNLLTGQSISTRFDAEDSSTLQTQGLDLRSQSLGIRTADFSSLHNVQNSRVDIANAIDLAVTLRNILSSDSATIRTRQEFSEIAMSMLTQISDFLSSPHSLDEVASYRDLTADLATDEFFFELAEDPQYSLIQNFKAPVVS